MQCIGTYSLDLSSDITRALMRAEALKQQAKDEAAERKKRELTASPDLEAGSYAVSSKTDAASKGLSPYQVFTEKEKRMQEQMAKANRARYGVFSRQPSAAEAPAPPSARSGGGEAPKTTPKKKKKKQKTPTFHEQFLDSIGQGPEPPNSKWIKMSRNLVDKGEILKSIELMPAELANGAYKAGLGRQEPNNFPELPPPKGRFDPSRALDPLYILQNTFGSKLLLEFKCVIILVACGAAVIVVGPMALQLITLASQNAKLYYLLIASTVAFTLFICAVRFECVSKIGCDPFYECCWCCPLNYFLPKPKPDEENEENEEDDKDDSSRGAGSKAPVTTKQNGGGPGTVTWI